MWLKGERYRDPVTGELSDPDQTLLKRVEHTLEVKNPEEFRRNLINMVAAFAIDHPGAPLEPGRIFPRYLEQLKESYFLEHRQQISTLIADMLALLSDAEQTVAAEPRKQARAAIDRLQQHGYCPHCARAALGELFKERYR
jgi:predicted Ser/Thr protein kinase